MQPSVAHNKAAGPAAIDSLAGDVEYYLTLTPRQLPSRYFYDALGSAKIGVNAVTKPEDTSRRRR